MFLLILYVTVALGFSFLCSVAEAVLLSVTPAYIAHLEQEGKPSGSLLRHQKQQVDRPLAAILSLNTIAHTVGAAGAGAQAAVVFGSQWVGLASVVLTFLILVLSEIIPKTLGAVYWRQLAPGVARALKWLILLLYPLVWLGEWLTRALSREGAGSGFRHEEMTAMAELGAQSGDLHQHQAHILKNLMRFAALRVADVMTPRTVMLALPEACSVGESLAQHPQLPFSRLPTYGQSVDEITGCILKTDLLLEQAAGREATVITDIKRPIAVIPKQATLPDAFDLLVQQRQHLLLVVDEYGGTAGLATLEDIVETLLGLEIVDEADQEVDMQQLARRQWRQRAQSLGLIEGDGNSGEQPRP